MLHFLFRRHRQWRVICFVPTHVVNTSACQPERSHFAQWWLCIVHATMLFLANEKSIFEFLPNQNFPCPRKLIGRKPLNLIVGWCGRFLFFVVPRQFSQDIGEWQENQILIPDWTYFHCPGAILVGWTRLILSRRKCC